MSTSPPSPSDYESKTSDPEYVTTVGPFQSDDRPDRVDAPSSASQTRQLPSLRIPQAKEVPVESENEFPRSTSATSSLDPYYFSIPSRNGSPVPPLPVSRNTGEEPQIPREPATPARDPASIDRNGLVGVGELLTPRWPTLPSSDESLPLFHRIGSEDAKGQDENQPRDASDDENDRGSPWTIEAVDGEQDECEIKDANADRLQNSQMHFIPDESGGEEILYPRKPLHVEITRSPVLNKSTSQASRQGDSSPSVPTSPPSSFLSPTRKAKKRSSDEFALDQSGFLVKPSSSNGTSSHREGGDKPASQLTRKHQSLVGPSSSGVPAREKRRGGSVRVSMVSTTKSNLIQSKNGKHSRQQSVGSISSNHGDPLRRRLSTSDSNSIPPSPSSSSQTKRVSGPSNRISSEKLSVLKDRDSHVPSNVAHSLLRGTQEGWSGLDDDATAEALRKLDGISGKGPRSRGSVGVTSRMSNNSRPGTPGTSRGHRSEGTEGSDKLHRMNSTGTNSGRAKERLRPESNVILEKEGSIRGSDGEHHKPSTGGSPGVKSADDLGGSGPAQESDSKKPVASARLSFTPKRSSASSTTYTATPTSSRESANYSTATSATSASVNSQRFSLIKARRNSAGSDVSSVYSADASSHKDRAASLATGDLIDGVNVPPVPPLPKDLSSYKTPPQSSTSLVFSVSDPVPESVREVGKDTHVHDKILEEPRFNQVAQPSPRQAIFNVHPVPETTTVSQPVPRTPSKKWSFTNPLSIRRSTSPNRHEANVLKSPKRPTRSGLSDKQSRPTSSSKDSPMMPVISPKSSVEAWRSIQKGAMASETSLTSLSSLSSLPEPSPPMSPSQHVGMAPVRKDEHRVPSRSGTASSNSATHISSFDPQVSQGSPTSRVSSRDASNKRLTPSSIPFFRRSSAQSVQIPSGSATTGMSTSPTFSSAPPTHHVRKADVSDGKDHLVSPTTPGFSHRKSSMLSLGLPSILKGSSSRKSLQVEKGSLSSHEPEKLRKYKDSDGEHAKGKKEEKDRSESRISVLMGRKRGKTLSSTDQKKVKPITLPPMQVSALPQATADRIAHVKLHDSASSSPPSSRPLVSSRLTSQTISSMQKQSDSSLRSTRQQLPTIAGSPSIGTHSHASSREPSFSMQTSTGSGLPKETPTRIPRIASRSSTVTSPALKASSSITSRRTSLNVGAMSLQSDAGDTGTESHNEFGLLDNLEGSSKSQSSSLTYRQSTRSSPPAGAKSTRLTAGLSAAPSSASIARKSAHESNPIKGLRKSSTGSVTSIAAAAAEQQQSALAALSPSKGLNKLLSPKMSLPGSRLSGSSTTPNLFQQRSNGSPTSRRQSFSTPSPVPSSVDEDEILGDEEMMQYIKRTQARKLAHGAKKDDLDELLKFPEPIPPARPSSPAAVLNGDRSYHLSDYERKEILDYSSVYFVSSRNEKKLATRDVSANNYGYDDDRGDYLVTNHDHLAYRYEIIDTLGKGSFGQVLHCRDHCTGESVAIKIIRNKKRFHHQALVEIKILENLRKWDPEEKHHVIKMTEHFYFRNHLCIAMELLSINLYELIKANGFAGFSTTLIRRFTSQMLLSLSLMRHHRIVHCDLKPENVLLRHPAKSGIKVIDFGSSCLEHEKVYTYIQSRFYRSPEVILGMNYSMAIDMWSLGCILAELYTGYPIFPGENEQEQLSCIMEVLGVPDKELINRSSRKRLFFDSTGLPRPVVNSKGRRRRPGTKTLAQVLRCDDELFVDFVSKCLSWDPEKRIKPQAALRHPFVTAGRRAKIINNPPPSSPRGHLTSSTSLLTVAGRNKQLETPKKSQISAPTPLTARSARTTGTQIPSTPLSSLSHASQSTSKSFRSYHAPYHSGRSANGLAVRNGSPGSQ
ncbi:uncharacterized protein FOMMEDRAFT_29176 [Fomitiporia mediterranea MF3/22]|uniref:uncharacterized protein n=1 Tax=Fomitiporia mediterranea (strain MF3/22) TaxID=694068 RepID=UPI0004408F3C|nr:uncharacterized protein FOMMEDRAFT_29176 [Fomitiporia mediterranea MF3/22]EJD02073.1 hypothetical protein FOMMEDRAFT_29176 [Fomitiporia mediterranea MF3/22]